MTTRYTVQIDDDGDATLTTVWLSKIAGRERSLRTVIASDCREAVARAIYPGEGAAPARVAALEELAVAARAYWGESLGSPWQLDREATAFQCALDKLDAAPRDRVGEGGSE